MKSKTFTRFKVVAERLRKARVAAGLSQKDVSDFLGYTTPQFVSNWERGLCSPPLATLKKICKLYNLDAEDVFRMILRDVEQDMRREFLSGRAG
jgi:transcriptional regulator with XRE-family HTH domain